MPIDLKTILMVIAMAWLVQGAAQDASNRRTASLAETLRNFAIGSPTLKMLYTVKFDPRAGEMARPYYQAAHGYRGQALIDRVGRGYTWEQLKKLGAVDFT